MSKKTRGEFLPDILEEGIQHHNRIVTDKAIREASHKYVRGDYEENHYKYSQYDRDRLTKIVWAKTY